MAGNVAREAAGRGPIAMAAAKHPLLAYMGLAYGISWAWWVPLALSGSIVSDGSARSTTSS